MRKRPKVVKPRVKFRCWIKLPKRLRNESLVMNWIVRRRVVIVNASFDTLVGIGKIGDQVVQPVKARSTFKTVRSSLTSEPSADLRFGPNLFERG